MSKIIYLEDYLKKQNATSESVMNDEPKFIVYPVDKPIFPDNGSNEVAFMRSVNAEIPSWLKKVVRFVTKYAYPSKGEDRCFFIWDLRKDIYNFLGYTWYSPEDIHMSQYSI